MARKAQAKPESVTKKRAARLYLLLTALSKGPQSRMALTRKLKIGLRGFYRDLDFLHKKGIFIDQTEGRYSVRGEAADAISRMPFPDPELTLGEARALAKGRSKAHRKLKEKIAEIEK